MHISTGDLLRVNIEKKTPLGVEAEGFIKRGELIPDESMIKCIIEELKTIKGSFLLDGFPRTSVQAEKLWEIQRIDSVVNLTVPYEIIIGELNSEFSSFR